MKKITKMLEINKFNQKDSLIMISSYPFVENEGAKVNAVACYSQNFLDKYKKRKVIVLAEKNGVEYKKQNNILINYCWRQGSPFLFFQIVRSLKKFSKVKNILIEFEFNMFASVIATALLPIFLLYLRLKGKNVTFVLHQVVNDLSQLAPHLGFSKHSIKNYVFSFGINLFNLLVGLLSNKVIVHEQVLKNRLKELVSLNKIVVISHGLKPENQDKKLRNKIRGSLNYKKEDFVLMFFGYITWYKGVDFLIKAVESINKINPRFKLLIVGGASATLKSKKHYEEYLNKIEKLIRSKRKFVKATGFVPENEVKKYFSASDLVVLPYRTLMSTSGPFSYALKFAKPFIISEKIGSILNNADAIKFLNKHKIEKNDFIFELNSKSFGGVVNSLYLNKGKILKISGFAKDLAMVRSWEKVVGIYDQTIFAVNKFEDFAKNFKKAIIGSFSVS